jgi:hypothetical protein
VEIQTGNLSARDVRYFLGLSQLEMSRYSYVSERTIRNAENHLRQPHAATQAAFLNLVPMCSLRSEKFLPMYTLSPEAVKKYSLPAVGWTMWSWARRNYWTYKKRRYAEIIAASMRGECYIYWYTKPSRRQGDCQFEDAWRYRRKRSVIRRNSPVRRRTLERSFP